MKLRVYFDGSCPFCTRAAAIMSRLDWLHQFDFINLHLPGVLEAAGIERTKALQRIQVENQSGVVFEGMRAILQISSRIPPLWVLVPVFWLSIQVSLGDRLYDWIADRRLLFPLPGNCDWKIEH